MSNSDRKQYLTATVLDQDLLDQMHDNLVSKIGLVVEIEAPPFNKVGLSFVRIAGDKIVFNQVNHALVTGNTVTISNATSSPANGVGVVLSFTDDTFTIQAGGGVAANGTGDVFSPKTIYASDENLYVGDTFYPALLKFPTVKRVIGEWLSPNLEFSTISIEINNADGHLNEFLPAGINYGGWIGKKVVIRMGLRDVESSYTTIFRGTVTDAAGIGRTLKSLTIVSRDQFEQLNTSFPLVSYGFTEYPDMEEDLEGELKPLIYGDWTVNVDKQTGSSIPCQVVNGAHLDVIAATRLIEFNISNNANTFFDPASVVLITGGKFYPIDAADIVNVSANNNYFEMRQKLTPITSTTLIEGALYEYKSGDEFFCRVRGKSIAGNDDNIVSQAEDLILTYSTLTTGDLDISWSTYKAKATPAESAIANIKSRIYRKESEKLITYVLSLFEQVRLEAFLDRNLKLKISSLHFEDFPAAPDFTFKNFNIENNSVKPKIDIRNNFNRCQGFYNLLPKDDEENNKTGTFRNQASITQSQGKLISKGVVFPNLYVRQDVRNQVIAILKLASSNFEIIDLVGTWHSLLLDISDFVKLDIKIGAVQFDGTPAMIRDIGYASKGRKLNLRMWSFQMLPYPGYNPVYDGIVGGYNATITEE